MAEDSKHCFVVMGFGIKTDLATGRKLNLDESYKSLIKPIIEKKGLVCLRGDEIKHSGVIGVPLYKQLLSADVVVADISTANANAFYELGLRHALRPRTTIVISEQQLCYPFDLNYILINKYTHLGDNIDYAEVLRFQKVLGDTLDAVLNNEDPDSPVYTFLSGLVPPTLQQKAEKIAQQVGDAIKMDDKKSTATEEDATLAMLVKQGEDAIKNKQYSLAKGLFNTALKICVWPPQHKVSSSNLYLYQRLALSTYKSREPDDITALKKAIDILDDLNLAETNDAETVVLAAKIEKRLFFKGQGDQHLAEAIRYYERAYFLLRSRYNGLNLAFVINNRVESSLDATEEDKIADMMIANRIRREVRDMCEKEWNKLEESNTPEKDEIMNHNTELAITQKALENEQRFWIQVNKAEACFGLGDIPAYKVALQQAQEIEHQPWMMEAFQEEFDRLKPLMIKYGHLLNPKWSYNS